MKKTNKVHPITAFRKANEARQAIVKKSLKKAQDGIETNNDMINKPGSTGGYKKPLEKYIPWEGQVELKQPTRIVRYDSAVKESKDNLRKAYNEAIGNNTNRKNTDFLNAVYPNFQIDSSSFSKPKSVSERVSKIKQKKGGSVKRKK